MGDCEHSFMHFVVAILCWELGRVLGAYLRGFIGEWLEDLYKKKRN